MIGLMLLAVNTREQQILKMAFEQVGFTVIESTPSYANYVKALQFTPDIIIIELPRIHADQLHFSSLIRKNLKTRKIPIIGYGQKTQESIKRAMTKNGVSTYIEKPIKFSILLELIQKNLKVMNKTLNTVKKTTQSEKETDIEKILDNQTLPLTKIELMVKHITGVMAFPFTVAKVLNLTESNKSGAPDLAKVIEADPVISANILKVANTVFFASLNRRINSIKDAIVRIGFRETKRIVLSITVMNMVSSKDETFGFSRMEFWKHQLATALISERLAKTIGTLNTDEAFLSGLLHDFGIILIDEFFPKLFQKILIESTNTGARFYETEQNLLGINHNDVVKEIFTLWKLPETITNSIVNHYTIAQNPDNSSELKEQRICLCTHMANIIAKTLCLGSACDQFVHNIPRWIYELLRIPITNGNKLYESLLHDLKLYQQFLNIEFTAKETISDPKNIGIYITEMNGFTPAEEYLRMQGHTITKIPSSSDVESFHKQFDIICAQIDPETTYESLEQLLLIDQKPDELHKNQQSNSYTPVLFIADTDCALKSRVTVQHAAFMNNRFDLRLLDDTIARVIEGLPTSSPQP